ncbi:Vgb family protein [Chondromyces apiculatus]|uniref:SMP-30/Gluconolactonase/LRE-like region domain-containing protein n=1 Tax=Chondromyces apiculatus DSM 436 TaxID=1192034 RepID=A0A017T5P1_9BACT|nr:hypothetical protein [Chondromyces apiculatus]EYF03901.1 Hypothetical protein CAP_5002 [Chondromyces apiculatus DSM 436]
MKRAARAPLTMLLSTLCGAHLLGCEVQPIVEGARLHSANGMAVDASGRLHVASILASEVVQLDPTTGKVLGRIGRDQGIDGPDDITLGPDGSLYWTGLVAGEVGRRTPGGVVTTQLVSPGVNPITFSSDGRLFVGLVFLDDALYEVDPALTAPPRLIARNWGLLNGFDFGPDGRLYAPVFSQGRVISIDVDSCEGATDPYTECDARTEGDGFFIPAAVKFDSQNRLHVVDQSGDVFRLDLTTHQKHLITHLAPGLDNLAFDAQDRLYVSSANDGFVVRVRTDGTTRTLSPGGMVAPGGIALVDTGAGASLQVADFFTMRSFDPQTGDPLGQITPFFGVSEQTTPTAVSADGNNLLVSSWFGNALQIWDGATGDVLESHTDFVFPNNAIRFQGDLIVAELGGAPDTGRILRQTSTDRIALAGGLSAPGGLAATNDDLWFADWGTGTVSQLIRDGVTLTPPETIAAGLDQPEGLALSPDGMLLVVESGAGRLTAIHPDTHAIRTLATGLDTGLPGITGFPPSYTFCGVAVSASGDVYVAGDAGNVIYKL